MLEAVTYRYPWHSGRRRGTELPDQGGDLRAKGARPDQRFRARLLERGVSEPSSTRPPTARAPPVAAAVDFAESDPSRRRDELAAGMYASGSDEQFAPMRLASPFGEQELVFDAGLGR